MTRKGDTLPDPEKFCAVCGVRMVRKRKPCGELWNRTQFARSKFCSKSCMTVAFRGRYQADVLVHEGRWRARKLGPKKPCAHCGTTRNIDRHHIDGDPLNNAPENLEDLCRSCHMTLHRRPTAS